MKAKDTLCDYKLKFCVFDAMDKIIVHYMGSVYAQKRDFDWWRRMSVMASQITGKPTVLPELYMLTIIQSFAWNIPYMFCCVTTTVIATEW